MANHLCECANDNLFLFFIYLFSFYENRYSRIEGERNKWRQEYLIKLKYFIICRNYFCFKFLPWKFLNKLAAVTKLFFHSHINCDKNWDDGENKRTHQKRNTKNSHTIWAFLFVDKRVSHRYKCTCTQCTLDKTTNVLLLFN